MLRAVTSGSLWTRPPVHRAAPSTSTTEATPEDRVDIQGGDREEVRLRLADQGFLAVSGLPPAQSVSLFLAIEGLRQNGFEIVTDTGSHDLGKKVPPKEEFQALSGGGGISLAARNNELRMDTFITGQPQKVIALNFFNGSGVDHGLEDKETARRLQDGAKHGLLGPSGLYQLYVDRPERLMVGASDRSASTGVQLEVPIEALDDPQKLEGRVAEFNQVCGKLEGELYKHRLEKESPSLWQKGLCHDEKFDWDVRGSALAKLIPAAAEGSPRNGVAGGVEVLKALEARTADLRELAGAVMEVAPRLRRQPYREVIKSLETDPPTTELKPAWGELFETTRDFGAAEQGYRLLQEMAADEHGDFVKEAFTSVYQATGSVEQAENACRQVTLGPAEEKGERLDTYTKLAATFPENAQRRYQTVLYRRLPNESLQQTTERYLSLAEGSDAKDPQPSATLFGRLQGDLTSGRLNPQTCAESITRYRGLRATLEELKGTERQAVALYQVLHEAILDGSMTGQQADAKIREMGVQGSLFGAVQGLKDVVDQDLIEFDIDCVTIGDITISRYED